MRNSRFTEEQIVAIVRESEREGMAVGQVAKKNGITEKTLSGGVRASAVSTRARRQHVRRLPWPPARVNVKSGLGVRPYYRRGTPDPIREERSPCESPGIPGS